jgi:hypothetical protein
MTKQFPPDFKILLKQPGLKIAMLHEVECVNPLDCKNCGGLGTMILFLGFRGPFLQPVQYKDEVNKYDQDTYGGKGGWWSGRHVERPCPVCHGAGRKDAATKESPKVVQTTYELTDRLNAR